MQGQLLQTVMKSLVSYEWQKNKANQSQFTPKGVEDKPGGRYLSFVHCRNRCILIKYATEIIWGKTFVSLLLCPFTGW